MKKNTILLALALLLLAAAPSLAAQFSVPGRVSQGHAFPASVSESHPFTAVFRWNGENLSVPASLDQSAQHPLWKAEILLAAKIDAKGSLPLAVRVGEQVSQFSIKVLPVAWPKSILTVPPRYVQPPQDVLDKIAQDRERSRKALAARTQKAWTLPLFRPVPGGITSPFGGRRVFNGQPRAPHMGTDMRSPEGASVMAVADGVVVLAEEQYYGGNTIYIDHGQGIFSIYCHLLAFDCAVGDAVRRGQVIARSGSTGRVTGPHLHFGFAVQGTSVDAMPLLSFPPNVTGGPSRSLYDTEKQKQAPSAKPKKATPKGSRQKVVKQKSKTQKERSRK